MLYICVFDFLGKKNVLYDYQFGFRQKHSEQHAIITLINKIHTSLEHDDTALTISLALGNSFDTLNHRILLQKLVLTA